MNYKKIPTCLLCNSEENKQEIKAHTVYGGKEEQKFWHCKNCDVVYLFPVSSEEEDKVFYENEFGKWMMKRSGDETWTTPEIQFEKMQKRELPLRMPWLKKYVKSGMKVLEIGSSSGFTLSVLQEMGCECVGVELSLEYADFARKKGLTIYSTLEEISNKFKNYFDVVLHYYVLEHVVDPLGFLTECLKYINSNGIMMFEVPNYNDPLISLYNVQVFNEFYWWRAHHWYFSPKSLSYVLYKLKRKYEIYPGQRYDLSNHIHWMLRGKPGGMGKYSNIFSRETEESYTEDLKRNWLCDYIIAIVY